MTATDTQPSHYLSVGETALLLRVHPSSVYKAVRTGALPAVRLSEHGTIRIPRAALEAKP